MNSHFKKGVLFGLLAAFCLALWMGAKTEFKTGTRVTADFLNTIYKTSGGHVHDGADEDGHASKINCRDHIEWDAGRCIPESALPEGIGGGGECKDISEWGASECQSAFCNTSTGFNWNSSACSQRFCGGFNWGNSSCKNKVAYAAQKFPETAYEFLPLEGLQCNDSPTEVYSAAATSRYVGYPASDTYCHFQTAWRPPPASTLSGVQLRVVYTTQGLNCSNSIYQITLKSADEPVDDPFAWDTEYNNYSLEAPTTARVKATPWESFSAADAQNDAGYVFFRGHIKANGQGGSTSFVCYLALLGIEIRYYGEKG